MFSLLDRYASLAISVASSMLLARLLTPTEIGVFSVTMVMLVLVTTVRDMGAGSYLMQTAQLTPEKIRAIWTVQLGLGLLLACVVVLLSVPAALLYKEPRMRGILLVVALNYAINPFGSLTYAWLMREMRFETVAVMRFSAGLSGALVSCFLAWHGHGPISLAYGALSSTIMNSAIASWYRPAWFPLRPGLAGVREVLSFGSKLTGSSLISSLSDSAAELILGKLQSLAAAGFYSRSNGLVQMFNRLFVDAVGSVCLPWFAKQKREQGAFGDSFLKATSYGTVFGWSFCLWVVLLAHPIIRLLYGPQWDAAVNLARLLAIAFAFSAPALLCNIALLASGAVGKIARLTALCAVCSVTLMALGASQSLLAVGAAAIAAAAISALLWLDVTQREIGVTRSQLLRVLLRSAMAASMTGIGPALVVGHYGLYPDVIVLPLVIGSAGALAGFILGVALFKHPIGAEFSLVWRRIKAALA